MSYRLDGPNGLTLEGWWYLSKIHRQMFASAGARDILYRTAGQLEQMVGTSEIVKYAQKNTKAPDKPLFAGIRRREVPDRSLRGRGHSILHCRLDSGQRRAGRADLFRRGAVTVLNDVEAKEKSRMRTSNVSYYLTSPVTTIAPGSSVRRDSCCMPAPKNRNCWPPTVCKTPSTMAGSGGSPSPSRGCCISFTESSAITVWPSSC